MTRLHVVDSDACKHQVLKVKRTAVRKKAGRRLRINEFWIKAPVWEQI